MLKSYFPKMLISGAQVPIDIEDLRIHTSYSGIYNLFFSNTI